MHHQLLLAVTGLGMACNLSGTLPQAVRTVAQRRTSGLAPTGLWLGVVSNALWLGYGIAASDPALLCLNAITSAVAVTVLAAYRRHGGLVIPGRLTAAAVTAVAVIAVLAAGGQAAVLAGAGALLGFFTGLPQLLALLRRRGTDGVAAGGYLVGMVGATAWMLRWGLAGNPAVMLSSGYGLLVNTTGLLLLTHRAALGRACRGLHATVPRPVRAPLRRLRGTLLAAG